MTQTRESGLRLRPKEDPRGKGWLLPLTALLGSLTACLTVAAVAGFSQREALAVMLVTASYISAFYGIFSQKREPEWFFPASLLVLLAVTIAARKWVLAGFCQFWNQMGNTMTAGTGWVLPQITVGLVDQGALASVAFGAVLGAGLGLISCWFSSRSPEGLAFLLAGGYGVGRMVFGWQKMLVAGWLLPGLDVLLLLCGGWKGRKNRKPILRSWLLYLTAGTLLLMLAMVTGAETWAKTVSSRFRESLHEYRYETENTILPEGDFGDYQPWTGEALPGLVVTVLEPETLYLRGFTGCTLENDRWESLDTETLAEHRDLLYWLNQNAFHPQTQLEAAVMPEESRNSVTIENVGACSESWYVPFTLCDGGTLARENLLETVPGDGQRTYRYSVLAQGETLVSRTLEALQTSDTPEVLAYRKAESAYRRFVEENYLTVPNSVKDLLAEKWDDIAANYGGVEHLTPQQAQACVLTFLSWCFPEGGTPENQELPLPQTAGTSFQYATVAVLTLRYFGIPARYAEGYLVTEAMASAAGAGNPISVDSSCARGWAEVYQEGIGWMPMAQTPGFGELLQELPQEQQNKQDEQQEEDQEEESKQEPEDSPTEIPEEIGGTRVTLAKTLVRWLWWLLWLVAIALLLALRRNWINRKRQARFRMEDRKEAVAWLFMDVVRLLEALGLDRGNGSVRPLLQPVRERFGEAYGDALEKALERNDRALFSSRPMPEADWEAMVAFRGETICQLETHIKWYRRLWLKWGRCLY